MNFTISVSTTILGGLIPKAQKAGLTKFVKLHSKRVFSTFAHRWGKSKTKNEGRSTAFKMRFFDFRGETKKNFFYRISVSCHHFGWAFPSSAKSRVDEGRPIAFKTRFFDFPHRGETKKQLFFIEFYNFGFMPPFWVGFSK